MKRILSITALVIALASGGTLLTAQAAGASASNCPAFPAFRDGTAATDCAIVYGTGLRVDQVYGTFTNLVHPVCNWTITAEFFDTSWRWYKTVESPVHSGCSRHSSTAIYPRYTARAGYLCSSLRSNRSRLTSYCFKIHA